MATSEHVWTYTRQRSGLPRWLLERLRVRVVEYSPLRSETSVRADWGTAVFRLTRSFAGLGICLISWGRGSDQGYWSILVKIPFARFYLNLPRALTPGPRRAGNWGAELSAVDTEFPSQLYLKWGRKYKFVEMPWALYTHRRSILLSTGNWYHANYFDAALRRSGTVRALSRLLVAAGLPSLVSQEPLPSGLDLYHYEKSLSRYTETHPYVYVLKSGEAQDVVATLTVDEWEARRRFLFWAPSLARIRRSIDVKFSSEIGEERGSWKGGVVGTSHNMLPGELPVHAIARMQQERRF